MIREQGHKGPFPIEADILEEAAVGAIDRHRGGAHPELMDAEVEQIPGRVGGRTRVQRVQGGAGLEAIPRDPGHVQDHQYEEDQSTEAEKAHVVAEDDEVLATVAIVATATEVEAEMMIAEGVGGEVRLCNN